MPAVTVAEAVKRIGNLSPFVRSANLQASGAFVCSPASEVPEPLRVAHEERHAFYMSHSGPDARVNPPHAPAYYVTSYGVLIAWVTLDGQTHYADLVTPLLAGLPSDAGKIARHRTIARHQAAVRAVWPERFIFDGEARVRGVIDPAPVTDDSEHETSGMIVYVAETGTETTPYVVNTEEDMRDNYAELVADGLAKDTDDGFRAYLDSWMSVKMPVEIWNTDGEQEWIAARV